MALTPPLIHRRQFIARTSLASAAMSTFSLKLSASNEPSALIAGERIDCQSHLFCPEAIVLMEKRQIDPSVSTVDGVRILRMGDWLRKIPAHYTDVDAKLAAMDAAGITRTA